MKKSALLAVLLLLAGLARADVVIEGTASTGGAGGVCGDRGRLQDGGCLQEDAFEIGPGVSLAFLTRWAVGNNVSSVKIDVLNAGQPVQTLELNDMSAPSLELIAEDLNFDGFKDLKLLASSSAVGNLSFMLWVFDPKTKQFAAFPQFLELSSPDADPQDKEINSHNRDANALIYVDKTWKWANGTLTKVAEERQDALKMEGYYYNVQRALVDGRPAVVGERIFRANGEGAEGETVCVARPVEGGGVRSSCGAIAAVIDFTAAEGQSDLEGMMAAYGPAVTWQGAPKDLDSLRAMHSKWLASLSDYTLTATNFRAAYSEDGTQAQVRCDVTGSWKDGAGKVHSFKTGKQFLLRRSGNKWLIECEEVAQFISGARGKPSDACQLPPSGVPAVE